MASGLALLFTKEVMDVSDYEMLVVVLMVITLAFAIHNSVNHR